jgi:hypothetical protein
MKARNVEQIRFTDKEFEKLCQRTNYHAHGIDSKVGRMLRHITQDCTRPEAIRDVKESINRIKYANTLLSTYEKLLLDLEK